MSKLITLVTFHIINIWAVTLYMPSSSTAITGLLIISAVTGIMTSFATSVADHCFSPIIINCLRVTVSGKVTKFATAVALLTFCFSVTVSLHMAFLATLVTFGLWLVVTSSAVVSIWAIPREMPLFPTCIAVICKRRVFFSNTVKTH